MTGSNVKHSSEEHVLSDNMSLLLSS